VAKNNFPRRMPESAYRYKKALSQTDCKDKQLIATCEKKSNRSTLC